MRLLQRFDSPDMTPAVWERLFNNLWDPQGRAGLVMLDGEQVVGFLGTIYSTREINGEPINFLNLTSWIVEESHRSQSLSLLFAALADKSQTLTDLTASPEATAILKRLGFKTLESSVGLYIGDQAPGVSVDWSFGLDASRILASPALCKVANDHLGTSAVVCAARLEQRECLVVCTITRIEFPACELSPLEQRELANAIAKGQRLQVAHIHYVSDIELLESSLPIFKQRLNELHGVDAVIIEGRFISDGATRWRLNALPLERLYRSNRLSPSQIDNLYSELQLMGVSGQGYIVSPEGAAASKIAEECNSLRKQIRENDRIIDRLDQEIRSLEKAEQEYAKRAEAVSHLQANSHLLQGIGVLSGRLRSYERAGYTRYPGVILMFHSVKPLSEKASIPMNRDLEVTPEYLRDVIRMCRESGREIVSLDEAQGRIKAGLQSDRPFAVLTFDDGYKDNLTHAYPVLKDLSAPFTVYLCTDFPDGKALLWWYLLEQKVRSSHSIELSINGTIKRYITATTSERLHAFHEIRYHLVTASSEERESLLQQLFGNEREQWFEFTKASALTWEEVRTLSKDNLCTIGAHTVTHPSLKQLDDSQLQFEIAGSRRIIEEQIGKPVQHFCYPYGSPINCGEREFRAVESAGFATATTTTMSPITLNSSTDMFALPRIPVRGTHESVDLMRILVEGGEVGEVLAIDEYVRELQRRLFMVEQLGISSPSPDMHILL